MISTSIKPGKWYSKKGSRLLIDIDSETGKITGKYATSHGRPDKDTFFDVTGWANGEMVAFTCSWGKHRSVSTWCGQLRTDENGKEHLYVMWVLAREFANEEQTIKTSPTYLFHTNTGKFYHQDGTINDA